MIAIYLLNFLKSVSQDGKIEDAKRSAERVSWQGMFRHSRVEFSFAMDIQLRYNAVVLISNNTQKYSAGLKTHQTRVLRPRDRCKLEN